MYNNKDKLAEYLQNISHELINYLSRRVESDAPDLLSEITILAYENVNKLTKKSYEEFSYWIFNVAWKKTCEWYRKKKKQPIPTDMFAYLEIEKVDSDPLSMYIEREQNDVLIVFLEQLSLQEKQLYIYRYVEELSYKEISARTGIGINTLLTRNRRFLEKLKQLIREQDAG